jgi:hypothetical protein
MKKFLCELFGSWTDDSDELVQVNVSQLDRVAGIACPFCFLNIP